MKELVINIGEYCVVERPAKIVCHGLGSCIGLFLYDRAKGIGSGAHIMYPDDLSTEKIKTKIAKYAFQEMLIGLNRLGADIRGLRAQMVGGASIYNKGTSSMGERNIIAVKKLLLNNGIYLSQEVVGGENARSATFYLEDGALEVTSIK